MPETDELNFAQLRQLLREYGWDSDRYFVTADQMRAWLEGNDRQRKVIRREAHQRRLEHQARVAKAHRRRALLEAGR